jgi:Mrp family chromosome partitioning ATPase
VQGQPWRLHPSIEEAIRPRPRKASPKSPSLKPAARIQRVDPARRPATGTEPIVATAVAAEKVAAEQVAAERVSAEKVTEATPVIPPIAAREAAPMGQDVTVTYPSAAESPHLSKLVQGLLASFSGPGPHDALFVSIDQGAQTTRLCADVAKTLAAAGRAQVLIVDGDRVRPTLNEEFGIDLSPGLADVLDGRIAIDAATVRVGPHLTLMPAGFVTQNGSFCVLPEQGSELMRTLKSRFDYVLVNGLSLDSGRDSLVFGSNVEGVVLVVAAHNTRRPAAIQAKDDLKKAGARLLGVALTERTFPIPDAIYRWL